MIYRERVDVGKTKQLVCMYIFQTIVFFGRSLVYLLGTRLTVDRLFKYFIRLVRYFIKEIKDPHCHCWIIKLGLT